MRLGIGCAALLALVSCGEAEMPGEAEGARVYASNCAACHGESGRGDGAGAVDRAPAPADLTLISQRAGGRFPVSMVLSKIDGYSADDAARAAMPEFGAMLRGEMVPVETEDGVMTPTPRPLAALLAHLQIIQK
ncbi:cytochrome c [Shimia sp.]|uniref:c-type cytochrome n=1 Tax=Shimia sp. TaxID=1954381 RepID=UPI003564164B